MTTIARALGEDPWGLARARALAHDVALKPALVSALIRVLFADDPERRKRAADVARRISESSPQTLTSYADVLAGRLAEIPATESRTRWHLGLAVPRVASTPAQRMRAARLMLALADDSSNVVRCSAVEGLTTLALRDPRLLPDAQKMVEQFLRAGTPAMKSRARHAARLLARAEAALHSTVHR